MTGKVAGTSTNELVLSVCAGSSTNELAFSVRAREGGTGRRAGQLRRWRRQREHQHCHLVLDAAADDGISYLFVFALPAAVNRTRGPLGKPRSTSLVTRPTVV